MKILVTGASGLLGGKILDKFSDKHEIVGVYNRSPVKALQFLDVCDENAVQDLVGRFKPDAVIHAASIVDIELCEKEKVLARKVNIEGTRNVSKACSMHGVKICYISSDYVFDGEAGPYKEESQRKPVNFYGETKLEGEKIVSGAMKNFLIVRPSVLYGEDKLGKKSFVHKVFYKLMNGEKFFADNVLTKYPLLTDDAAEAIMFLIEGNKDGFFHVVGQEATTYYSWAHAIAEELSLDKRLIFPVSSKGEAIRPKNVLLDDSKLKSLGFRYQCKSVAEGIKMMKKSDLGEKLK